MFKVISDIMAQWNNLMVNAFIITINFCNEKDINCALLFIISNHNGRIVLSCIIQLEYCNDMLKVISDSHGQYICNYNHNGKKNCTLTFIISNDNGRMVLRV